MIYLSIPYQTLPSIDKNINIVEIKLVEFRGSFNISIMKNTLNIQDPKFIDELKKAKTLDNQYLASYLTGFLEADGCIYVVDYKEKYPKSCIHISFAFNKDDTPFAEFLKEKFQMGVVSPKDYEYSTSWDIYKESDILKLLMFCNGHFRTPKIGIFAKGLKYFEEKHNISIPILPLCTTSVLEDGWLSGFSEGDSSFQVGYVKSSNSISITPTYVLEVAENYSKKIDTIFSSQSNKIFMETIANIYNVNLGCYTRKPTEKSKETSSIKLRINRVNNLNQLINYFYNFPLFSSKYLNFIDWATIISKKVELKLSNKKISDHYLDLKKINDGMNSKRTFFNWDHLQSFYKIPLTFPTTIDLKFKNGRK